MELLHRALRAAGEKSSKSLYMQALRLNIIVSVGKSLRWKFLV